MSEAPEEKFVTHRSEIRRRRPSFFGPIVLIAVGVFFLLYNLNVISGFKIDWIMLVRLWPLWLIFIGVNVIVRQIPGAVGSLLSAMVGLLAVAVFGYVLLFAEDNAMLNRLQSSGNMEVQTEAIRYGAEDVDSAAINIELSSAGADLYALEDSDQLIEGTVSYTGELIFNTSVSGGRANIDLDTTSASNEGFFFLNPTNWISLGEQDRWQIGLSPDVETELRVDISSGSANLDLSEALLSRLDLDGGSGSLTLSLPGGDYSVDHNAGSGSTRMTLAQNGRQEINVEGGSGSMTFDVPAGMEARVEVQGGSGGFSVDRDQFMQVSGDQNDEGVWETAGYDDAPDRVNLIIDIGSGSVRIRQP
jgi:hypothetical protein